MTIESEYDYPVGAKKNYYIYIYTLFLTLA